MTELDAQEALRAAAAQFDAASDPLDPGAWAAFDACWTAMAADGMSRLTLFEHVSGLCSDPSLGDAA